MSRSRVTAPTAVLVCRVDITRCPVKLAWTAICAVSRSRIRHHHHVGVLAQDRAQPAGEGHLHARVDLGLADAVDVVLDRVLDGHDVARAVVDAVERGIERRRLARARRTGHEQDAVRLVDQLVDVTLRGGIHAERVEVEPAGLLVEQAQHHALAVSRRDGRYAHVHRAPRDAQRDASVLRQAFLGDVEPRHDFDARHDQRRHGALGLEHFAQHPVHAEADHQAVLERLDVDVRPVLLHRLGQEFATGYSPYSP